MVDKITTVTKAKLGRRIGQLEDKDVLRLNRAVGVPGPRRRGLGGLTSKRGAARPSCA